MNKKLSYYSSVNYNQADPMKVLAQREGEATAKNMPYGFREVEGTRGESAYVFRMGRTWGAFVQEGLGTKSLIAKALYEQTGTSHFAAIAQDTVACVINDLVSVGATPVVLNAYWSSNSYEWLADHVLAKDFIEGWRSACDIAHVVWGGGETQSLKGVILPGVLEFAGSSFGIIKQKKQLIQGKNLKAGDAIILVESNGVHANGISLIRQIAEQLTSGYQTKLKDGSQLGETALRPTHIYSQLVHQLFENDIDVHYLSNITGHGWRKLMRADVSFTYRMTLVPPVAEIFNFIAQKANNDEKEMYGNFNMGAGFAIYLPAAQVKKAQGTIKKCGFQSWNAGTVEDGPKQVIIQPKNLVFQGDTLGVR